MTMVDKSRLLRRGLAFGASGVAIALALRLADLERERFGPWVDEYPFEEALK